VIPATPLPAPPALPPTAETASAQAAPLRAADAAHPSTAAAPIAAPSSPQPGAATSSDDQLKLSATLSPHSDLLEQRLLATERWLEQADRETYSIQLLGSNDPALLRGYFETLGKYIEIEKVFVYRTVANQQPSMTVLYGAFRSRSEATQSLEGLPEELKANRPYIRTVQGIRTEIGLRKPS